MSDNMMSVEEALSWLDPYNGPKPEVPSPLLVDRYARTVIEQAETIQTLSRLLAEAEEAAIELAEQIVRLRQAMTRLRDTYAAPDDPGDDYGRGAEAAYQIVAADLTRILEGDNDE